MSVPLCTPTKKLTQADRHALFEQMYGDLSQEIKTQVEQGRSWREIQVALLARGNMSNFLSRACEDEARYWRGQ